MTVYNAIGSNKRKSILLILFFILFFGIISYIFSKTLGYGLPFVGIMLIISGLMSFFSYFYSDRLVLSMSGAKPATKSDYPELYRIVENLSIGNGQPMPRVYVINDPALNAFATGRDPKHAVVAATTGILERLEKIELEGVIAHELSHVKNYDTRLMGIVSIIAGSIAILADGFMRALWWGGLSGDNDRKSGNAIFLVLALVVAILAPIAATIVQLAVSRKREFLADASGALLTRYPEGLARALEKFRKIILNLGTPILPRPTSIFQIHSRARRKNHGLFTFFPPTLLLKKESRYFGLCKKLYNKIHAQRNYPW